MLTNLSFETAGSNPGEAASWTWSRTAPFLFEGFSSSSGLSRFDGFELGWDADDFVDELVVPTNAISFEFANGTPIDGFETGWRLPNSHGLAQSGIVNPFGNVAPFALVNGHTLTFKINGSSVTAVFNDLEHGGFIANISAAQAIEVVHTINSSIGLADITDGFAFSDGFGHVFIQTDETGSGASIAITGGTASATLGFVEGVYVGGVNSTHPGNETALFSFAGGASDTFYRSNYVPVGMPGSPTWSENATGAFFTYESFESGWPSNEVYFRTFSEVNSSTAIFGDESNAFENFESGWKNNENYVFAFNSEDLSTDNYATSILGYSGIISALSGTTVTMNNIPSVPSAFANVAFVLVSGAASSANNGLFPITYVSDAAIEYTNASGVYPDANSGSIETQIFTTFESFEYVFADRQVTAVYNGVPSYFTYQGGVPYLLDGTLVTIYAGTAPNGQSGIIPTGVNPLIQYFVAFSSVGTPNSFSISLNDSTALDFTDNGSGVIMVKGDTGVFWTLTTVGI